MSSFIESGYATRKEWEAAGGGGASLDCPTLGYWKIRGLAAPPRMMLFFKGQKFTSKAYGEDAKDQWFGGDKATLLGKNGLVNLPYVIDGETVVTQSNSVLLYLGKRLGIDKEEHFFANHQVLDQTMDLRNDTMKIAYPFSGVCKTVEEFPAALEKHMKGAAGHFAKLEAFCEGPFMCGSAPQSGDFHVFEMLDQHLLMCAETKLPFDTSRYPKLLGLHAAMKAEPKLASYFASDFYLKWAVNNPSYCLFAGPGFSGVFGPTLTEVITP